MQLLSVVCIETHQSNLKAQDTAHAGPWFSEYLSQKPGETHWVLFDPALGFPLFGNQRQAPYLCHSLGPDMASGSVSSEMFQRPRLAKLEIDWRI